MPSDLVISESDVTQNQPETGQSPGPPVPLVSPLVITNPGTQQLRFPPSVALITVDQWAPGHDGATGAAAVGGDGGAGGAHATFTMTNALYSGGASLTITCGGRDAAGTLVGSTTSVSSSAGGVGVLSDNGTPGFAPAKNTVTAGAGLTVTANNNGNAGAGHAGGVGGAGGQGGGAGGAGGAGGLSNADGKSGVAPGGGGGGGGDGTHLGGNGGNGKLTITW